MKKFILVVVFGILFGFSASSTFAQQSNCPPVMPVGTLCISQEAGNKAAENARLVPELKNKIETLNIGLEAERENTKKAQEIGRLNVADITDRMHKTEVELAMTKGQFIECGSERTRLIGLTELLVKNARPKKNGFINLF